MSLHRCVFSLLPALCLALLLACSSTSPPRAQVPVDPKVDIPSVESPAFPSDSELTRIGFGSCLHQNDPQPILERVKDREFELFLFLGDNVYGDVSSTDDLVELREAYRHQAQAPAFRELASSTPLLATWDDHDYGLNDAGATFAGREEAEALFELFWDIPQDAPSLQRPGVYQSHIAGPPGRRVQILLLDTRYFRSDLKKSTKAGERYSPDNDPQKTLLGEEQWRWLEGELRKPAEIRLLVSSIQILADGHGWEAWRTLPLERERLYRVLQQTRAKGVIALSGDRHRAGIYRHDDVIAYPFFEVTSSSLNRPSGSPEEPGPHRLGPSYRPENFGAIDIDWEEGKVLLEIVDIEGQTVLSEELTLQELQPADGRD